MSVKWISSLPNHLAVELWRPECSVMLTECCIRWIVGASWHGG